MAVTEITLGKSGTGKSYYVVYHLVTQWLPFSHNQKLYTNLPLNIDEIAKYFVQNQPGIVSSWVTDRISLIDRDVTQEWMTEKSGPWEYFRDKDLSGCRVVLDEIHNYVHSKSKAEYIHKWRQWLGELRHQGCEFEAISQYEVKIHPLIRHECGLKRTLDSFDDKRDPVFWVKFYDHFQLVSKVKGYWSSRVWYAEYKPGALNGNTWEKCGGGTIPLVPMYYALYNSYSAPIAGHGTSSKIQPHPFQRMQWSELLKWYALRNFLNIIIAAAVYSLLIYLFMFGGLIDFIMSVFTAQAAKSTSTDKKTEQPLKAETKTDVKPSPVHLPPSIKSPRGVFDANGRPWVPPAESQSTDRPKA